MYANPLRTFLVLPLLWLFANTAYTQGCEANFTFESTGITIQFIDLSTSDAGDPIVSWDWDFDDGSGSSQQNPIHTFPEPDKYDVVLTITTASGCTATFEIRIETCAFNVTYSIGNCNANDEVPVTFNISDIYDNADDINISLDGVLIPGSPFQIDAANPVNITVDVPGDGLMHTLTIVSEDITTCSATIDFTVPDCGSNCFLGSMAVAIAGGSTQTVQVGDNFFSPVNTTIVIGDVVEFQWIGDGHSTTSDATSGPDSWNSGEIGTGSIYPVTITNPGVHPYYCIPHGGPGGSGMAGTIVANCPASGQFMLNITFNTTIADPAGYNVLIDGVVQPGSPHNYNGTGPQSVTASISGDGQSHVIEIQDVAVPSCIADRTFLAPDCGAAPACSLSVTAVENGPCSAQDEVPVDLTVNAINPGPNGFTVSVDGVPQGSYPYDASGSTMVTIQVPGDGQSHTITVTDQDDSQCTGSTTITTTNCTIPCSISNVSATAGAAATHVVLVEDFQFTPANITITAGDVVEWQWVGAIDHTATSDAASGPDSWDSGLLGQGAVYTSPILSTGVHPYYCIPHGAPGGVGMAGTITVEPDCTNGLVSVSVSFNASGGGFNGYEILVDGTSAGTFAYSGTGTENAVVSVPGDGQSHTILIQDVDNPGCSATTTITTPDCNASTCQLTVSATETGGCDAQDNVNVEVTINDVGGGAGGFEVFVDGASQGTFSYSGTGTTIINLDVTGDGQSHTILIQDIDDAQCNATTTVTTSNCVLPCSINGLNLTILGGGNPVTHVVEVVDFDFIPQNLIVSTGDIVRWEWTGQIDHTATSDATSGPDSWDSGLLGQGAIYEEVIDQDGQHPYYCIPHGTPGGVGMAGNITAMPPSPCVDGMVSIQLSFSQTNTGNSGYNLYVDGSLDSGSPYTYGGSGSSTVTITLPGDGQQHTIEIGDVENGSCSATQTITLPDCQTGGPCSLEVNALNIGACDTNNEVAVDLEVNASNTSTAFNLYLDGNLYPGSPFDYDASGTTLLSIAVSGTGTIREVVVADIDSTTCTDLITFSVPSCGPPCVVENLQISTDQAATHIVEVRDYDFFPADIDVLVGDTVRFVWTGVVDHTTTSDALNGPDSWDSGLLGQGAVYDVVIQEAGMHPYYCIPHGGPGGIGMAGTIEAFDGCDQGNALVVAGFDVTNGSPLGYNVFLDGELLAGPFTYDNPNGYNSVLLTIPGDGLNHTLTIQDLEVTFCALTTIFTAPECEVTCEVQGMEALVGADIVHIVEVLDYEFAPIDLDVRTGETIRFVWNGIIPHTTTSDATSGPDSWDSGLLGQGAAYELILENAGDHPYYCIPHGGPGGIGMAGNIHATEDCADGMVAVQINFSITSGSATGYNVFVDGVQVPGGPFAYDDPAGMNSQVVFVEGDGDLHLITVQDTETTFCASTVQVSVPDCSASCAISNVDIQFPETGPQVHEVEVGDFFFEPTMINIALGDTVRFIWTGAVDHTTTSDATSGPDVWDSGLIGNGSIFDVIPQTTGTHPYYCTPHGGPGGIGMAGVIEVNEGSDCVDGQIMATIAFDISEQGSTGFNVFIDGLAANGNPYPYSGSGMESLELPLDGDGQLHELIVADADDPFCADTISYQAPLCESTNCTLVAEAAAVSGCEDNNLIEYELTITSSNTGAGGFDVTVDGDLLPGSPFSYDIDEITTVTVFLTGDGGTRLIEVQDVDSLNCSVSLEVETEDCAQPCSMNLSATQISGCDADGFLTYDITVSAGNFGAQGFSLNLDGTAVPGSPFDYTGGITTIPVQIPGDGGMHELIAADIDSVSCVANLMIEVIDCSGDCSLDVHDISINVPGVQQVDVLDFVFEPEVVTVATGDTVRFVWLGEIPHTTTSDASSGADVWNSGLLGQGSIYDLVLETAGSHPYYCVPHGAPGGIGMAGTIIAESPCDDGMLNVLLEFTTENAGPDGFNVFLDGTAQAGNPYPYDVNGNHSLVFELPGDGQEHEILIADALDADCMLDTLLLMPDCDDLCFGYEADFSYEIDHSNLSIDLTDLSSSGTDTWEWTFGDGETSNLQNPVHTFAEAGTYEICLIATDTNLDCSDTLCIDIEVGGFFCEASFTFESDGLSLFLGDISNSSETITNWVWTVDGSLIAEGDPSTSYTFPELGVYEVCLTIFAGACEDDTCMTIDLSDPCLLFEPAFEYTVDHQQLEVEFEDLTSGNPHLWLWGFGDGFTSNDQHPVHQYDEPGVYNVCLLVQDTINNCNKSACALVEVGMVGTTSQQLTNFDLILHPNPGPVGLEGWFLEGLSPNDFGEQLEYEIFGVDGRTYSEGTMPGEDKIFLQASEKLSSGVYFIQIRSDERLYQGKAIIQ
ncbi:MAG: PKD domain-containing protein [Bacteroidetes bacterium]|nr:PKD domain-containing protein [Bacteroidota bacterium]